MEAIILLGAPGAGKGTAAEKIRELTSYAHVATGDMLRDAVKRGSDLGREAEGYMQRGELVPDEIIIRLVEERLDAGRADGRYMFDGFPRTVRQAELLEQSIARRGGRLRAVFFLDAPRAVLVSRLGGRRICRKCGMNFHVVNIPPRRAGVCDACGEELYQRADDEEATIMNRLDVYARQTAGLIARYEGRNLLVRVNSDTGVDALVSAIRSRL
ncbi:MAG: adenylate kinase [Lentisphaerae bacterium]|nr:adenylate kinase [Lentisphaerota bacterium]